MKTLFSFLNPVSPIGQPWDFQCPMRVPRPHTSSQLFTKCKNSRYFLKYLHKRPCVRGIFKPQKWGFLGYFLNKKAKILNG